MTATVCTYCQHVLVEHGRGHVHLETGNYRCVGIHDGDGFARPTETLLYSTEITGSYDEGYEDGYAAGVKECYEDV